jgi:hypothetical protein
MQVATSCTKTLWDKDLIYHLIIHNFSCLLGLTKLCGNRQFASGILHVCYDRLFQNQTHQNLIWPFRTLGWSSIAVNTRPVQNPQNKRWIRTRQRLPCAGKIGYRNWNKVNPFHSIFPYSTNEPTYQCNLDAAETADNPTNEKNYFNKRKDKSIVCLKIYQTL